MRVMVGEGGGGGGGMGGGMFVGGPYAGEW